MQNTQSNAKTKVREFFVTEKVICLSCDGTGQSDGTGLGEDDTCPKCDGVGVYSENEAYFHAALSECLDEDDVFKHIWETVEGLQSRVAKLEEVKTCEQ